METLDRLKAAFKTLRGEESEPHPYGIKIGEDEYKVDAYRISKYGHPEWYLVDPKYGNLKACKYDGWILKDYNPTITLDEFKAGKDDTRIDRSPMVQ